MTGRDVDTLTNDELRRIIEERNNRTRQERFYALTCYRCGKTQREEELETGGHLVDIRITVAEGEEGHSDITKYVCDEHLIEFQNTMEHIGFTTHVHGGICFLEDTTCPGYTNMSDCPTPEEQYGDR